MLLIGPEFVSVQRCAGAPFQFEQTGSLGAARYSHTAPLLQNGKVLVAGGVNSSSLATAELYDPATGTWTTASKLNTARTFHTATLLPSGKMLIVGGYSDGRSLASAELYDPVSGK